MLLREITFLRSSPHPSVPALLRLRDAVGSRRETTLESGKGQSFSGGKQCPSCLLYATSDKFPNAALPHFPTETVSSPPHWVTTIQVCAVGLVLPTWG